MEAPSAARQPYTDQWGTFISGFAPIRDKYGNAVAVLGVDKWAEDVRSLTLKTFQPVLAFLLLFFVFVIIRLMAFHRPLMKELLQLSKTRKALASLAGCSLIALLVTFGMYKYTLELMKDEIGQRLMSIAATAASQINAKDLEPLRFARDMERPEYQRVYNLLNEVRNNNIDVKWIYILRSVDNARLWEFVVDADSNYYLPSFFDEDQNGEMDESEENVWPGFVYDVSYGATALLDGIPNAPIREQNFVFDQWGTFLTGYAPITNELGKTNAILGVDIDTSDLYKKVRVRFIPWIWFSVILLLLILLRIMFLCIGRKAKSTQLI